MSDRPKIVHSDGRQVYGDVVRPGRYRTLPIDRPSLDHISISNQASLHFSEVVITIGCPFVLTVSETVHDLDPEDRGGLGPLLALYPDALTSASVTEEGALHLEFDSGASLAVPQDATYEAWQVHDNHGWLLVCLPGTSGDLAEWQSS